MVLAYCTLQILLVKNDLISVWIKKKLYAYIDAYTLWSYKVDIDFHITSGTFHCFTSEQLP